MNIYAVIFYACLAAAMAVATAVFVAISFVWSVLMKLAQALVDGIDYYLPDLDLADNPLMRAGAFALIGLALGIVVMFVSAFVIGDIGLLLTVLILVAVFAVIGLLADPATDWTVKLRGLTDEVNNRGFPFNP